MQGEQEKFEVPDFLQFCTQKYEILASVGEGTFSTVFQAKCRMTGSLVAIKAVTKTTSPFRAYEELQVLKKLDGKNNCIGIIDVMRNQDQVLIVMPYVPHVDFKTIILAAEEYDIKSYLYSLITAIAHMHMNGIIHRDLKPGNFLYDLERQKGYLIDFGLACLDEPIEKKEETNEKPMIFFNSIVKMSKPPGYYTDDSRPQMKAPRAGTRGFRAPEVLFKSIEQDCAIDMWSVGVIMLCLMTTQYPFFFSAEDIDGLVEHGIIFGNAVMRRVAKYYGRVWKTNLSAITEEGIPFKRLVECLNPGVEFEENAYDLLEKLLEPINTQRISAMEAMEHPFFAVLKR